MRRLIRDDPTRPLGGLLLVCLFFSGGCGLVYEVAWMRALELLFGKTAPATATVLAVYMAGLGFGAHWFGRVVDRASGRGGARLWPVALYALLEGAVGVYALVTPALWRLVDRVDIALHSAFNLGPTLDGVIKFIIAFVVLFPPTAAMGGTLPAIAKFLAPQGVRAGRTVGVLYAVNTAGAAAGVFVSGFVSLPWLGVTQTVLWAGALNLAICAGCAIALAGRIWRVSGVAVPGEGGAGDRAVSGAGVGGWVGWGAGVSLGALAVSGVAAMVCEVVWTRVLALVLGSSVYAFATMLGTFLVGIALGSALFGVLARRPGAGAGAFVPLQFLAAFCVLGGVGAFDGLPHRFAVLYEWARGVPALMDLGRFALCALVMLPPTLCLGAAFPAFLEAWRRREGIGRRLGTVYLANTLGNIVGALLAGFVLIPAFGLERTLLGAAVLSGAVGLAAAPLASGRPLVRILAACLAFACVWAGACLVRPWERSLLTSGVAVQPGKAAGLDRWAFEAGARQKVNLFYREGRHAVVSVDRWIDNTFLSVNGKVDASMEDACTQFLSGHLPMLLHPGAADVLVIGLGSGSTLAAVGAHPARRIDCVEIEEAVVDASPHFARLNRGALADPRVRLFVADGRNFVRGRPGARYDVVISEPSNPWMAGVASLFTLDHYRNVAARLAPGGIFCQWCQAYSLSADDLRLLVRTFLAAFPGARLWSPMYPDLLLIGTAAGVSPVDLTAVRRGFERPAVRADLARHCWVRAPEGIFASFMLDDPDLRRFAGAGPLHTDDHPRLEFGAPRDLYRDTVSANLDLLLSFRTRALPAIANLAPPPSRNPTLWNEIARVHVGRGEPDAAGAALDRSRAIEADNPGWLEVAGMLRHAGGGDSAGAFSLLERALARGTVSPEARVRLGRILCDAGQFEEGTAHLEAALALEPEDPAATRALADCAFGAGRMAEARRLYARVLEIKGHDFHSSTRLAQVAVEGGDPAAQEAAWREMIARYPHHRPAYEELARLLERAGRVEEALEARVTATTRYSSDPEDFIELSRHCRKLGRDADADRFLRRAIRMGRGVVSRP